MDRQKGSKKKGARIISWHPTTCHKGGETRQEICTKADPGDVISERRDHFVRLGADVRSDLMWWQHFLESWNGIGILANREMGQVDLFTDASGKWGRAGV